MPSGSLTLNFSSIFGSSLRRASQAILACAAAIAVFLLLAAPACAQEHWPQGAVARFTGEDISYEGSTLGAAIPGGTSFFVSSGTVLTVHSGDARLNLPGGGTVDICGPAKLTILESNTTYTLALNFGRLHVRLGDPTQLHVFTPFVMATPVAIAEEARDFTIGLDINDAMCVFAAQGATRLEDQFSSEGLVVPQLGEFFLSGEKLQPVGGPAGTCRCYRNEAQVVPTPRTPPTTAPQPNNARSQPSAAPQPNNAVQPNTAVQPNSAAPTRPATATTASPTSTPPASKPPASKPVIAAPPTPTPSASPTPALATSTPPPAPPPAKKVPPAAPSKPQPPTSATTTPQQPPPAISDSAPRERSVIPTVHAAEPPPPPDNGFDLPAHANETPPISPRTFGAAPAAPQLEPPVRVVMPPLAFSAATPNPPVDPNPQLVTLIREAHVTRDWVFTGHVAETKSAIPTNPAQPTSTRPKRKRRGILTVFKQFFGGNPPPPKP